MLHARGVFVAGALALGLALVVPHPGAGEADGQRAPAHRDDIFAPILVYHHIEQYATKVTPAREENTVSPEVFAQEMAYLHHAFTVVPLASLVAALDGGPALPAHAVVLTFDDGWLTQYTAALPVLRREGFAATFFVTTSSVSDGPAFMTWAELRELQQAGMSIESHSKTHPRLDEIASSVVQDEVTGSREAIKRHLGAAPRFFAYPFGAFTSDVEVAVRRAGYDAARACAGGGWNGAEDRWTLHAIVAPETLDQFRRSLEPIHAR